MQLELKQARRWYVVRFEFSIREHVAQFLDSDTAAAIVELEIEIYHPELHRARRASLWYSFNNPLERSTCTEFMNRYL